MFVMVPHGLPALQEACLLLREYFSSLDVKAGSLDASASQEGVKASAALALFLVSPLLS